MKTVKRELTGAYLPETVEELTKVLALLGYKGEPIWAFVYWNNGQDDPRGYAAEINITGRNIPIFMFGFEDADALIVTVESVISSKVHVVID